MDISSIETAVLQAAGIAVLGVASWAGTLISQKFRFDISTATKAEMEDVATKSLTWALTAATDTIKLKGWDHIDIKNQVISDATRYAVARFPDALKRSGVDLDNFSAASQRLSGVLERTFPAVVATHLETVAAATEAQATLVAPPIPLAAPQPLVPLRPVPPGA
jgi:hypothetical protein